MAKFKGGLRFKGIIKKNKKKKPLISLITTNLNSKNFEKTIKSVINSKYKNIEYIIIDGGSKKKYLNIIKKYEKKIDFWISEKDRGIWHAYNKGYKASTGKFVGLVPSNDILTKNAINYLVKYINNYPNIDFVVGAVKKKKIFSGFNPKKINLRFNLLPSFVLGFFIKKTSLKKVGYLNEKYKCGADYDLLYRMLVKYNMKGVSTKSHELFGIFDLKGFSSRVGFWSQLYWELKIRFDNKQSLYWLIIIFFGRIYKKFLFTFIFLNKKKEYNY